ncbi:MAG: hypothetical protein A3K18_05135 [Lentisphaerae bacterium RIFOXYA12_64_32]|nr:MAG: hypothetical protein A3K18_05135 [Lentisphaerae bacterium RIFOXYA12_64_32]
MGVVKKQRDAQTLAGGFRWRNSLGGGGLARVFLDERLQDVENLLLLPSGQPGHGFEDAAGPAGRPGTPRREPWGQTCLSELIYLTFRVG